MKRISTIILAFLFTHAVFAQAPAVDSTASDVPDSVGSTFVTPTVIDTTLDITEIVVSTDSINAIKRSKDYADYSTSLDSLLRAAKKEQLQKRPEQAQDDDPWVYKLLSIIFNQYVLLTFGIVFVVFILYKLFFADGIFERRSATIKIQDEETEEAVHHSVADYYPLIDRAIAAGNYRSAVRYLFLQSLQQLSDDKLISLAPDKTNYQYLFELKDSNLRNMFSSLTLHYEYVWYGRFELDAMGFSNIQDGFKKFMQQL